jgi:Flp pilus assembly pilin Flp
MPFFYIFLTRFIGVSGSIQQSSKKFNIKQIRAKAKMKIFNSKTNSKRAIAMTEYLIILAIVAIAAIAVIGLFGNQIKEVFYRNTSTLGGQDASGSSASSGISSKAQTASTVDNMGSFDASKNSNK